MLLSPGDAVKYWHWDGRWRCILGNVIRVSSEKKVQVRDATDLDQNSEGRRVQMKDILLNPATSPKMLSKPLLWFPLLSGQAGAPILWSPLQATPLGLHLARRWSPATSRRASFKAPPPKRELAPDPEWIHLPAPPVVLQETAASLHLAPLRHPCPPPVLSALARGPPPPPPSSPPPPHLLQEAMSSAPAPPQPPQPPILTMYDPWVRKERRYILIPVSTCPHGRLTPVYQAADCEPFEPFGSQPDGGQAAADTGAAASATSQAAADTGAIASATYQTGRSGYDLRGSGKRKAENSASRRWDPR